MAAVQISRLNDISKLLIATLLLFAWPAWAVNEAQPEPWNIGDYETKPADGDTVGQGDDHFRTMKEEIRERLEVEHHFGSAVADDTGLHRLGSGRCFFQATAPTDIEQDDHENTGAAGESQLDQSNSQPSNNPDGDDEIVGMGRCWIDSDDGNLYIYTNAAEIEDAGGAAGWLPATYGQINLLENGSFEVTDAGGGGADPSIPDGWTDTDGLANLIVNDTGDSEGDGFSFTGISDAVNEALTQTLDGAGLKPSTTYLIYGRVAPAVTTCSLLTTGAGTNAGVVSANGGANWETLLDTFITNANTPPTDVVVRLESVANGSDCEWDHIFVVEYESRRQLPERVADVACTNTATVPAYQGLSVRTQIPWPKSVIRVHVFATFTNVDDNTYTLEQSIDGAAATNVIQPAGDSTQIHGAYMTIVPTANTGSEYVYSIAVDSGTPVVGSVNAACLFLEAYPL